MAYLGSTVGSEKSTTYKCQVGTTTHIAVSTVGPSSTTTHKANTPITTQKAYHPAPATTQIASSSKSSMECSVAHDCGNKGNCAFKKKVFSYRYEVQGNLSKVKLLILIPINRELIWFALMESAVTRQNMGR